jgi:probable blue pigment (indigoidine) exporter
VIDLAGDRRRQALFLASAAACWGVGTVISKQAVSEFPPLTLLAVQLGTSVGFLLAAARARGQARRTSDGHRLLARLGLLNPGLAYALSLAGLTQISASLSVLLWASEPILILGLAALFLGERVGPAILGPSLVAIAGLVLALFDPAVSGSALGIALTVAGVLACAIYSVSVRRWLPGATDSTFEVVLGQQVHALGFAVVLVLGVAATGRAVAPTNVTALGVGSALASGLLYYSFAYLFYLSALRAMPVSVAAASFYLIPIFGVAGGWLAGERLEAAQWIGALLVVTGVALITTRRRSGDEAARLNAGPAPHQPSSAASSAQMATTPRSAIRR